MRMRARSGTGTVDEGVKSLSINDTPQPMETDDDSQYLAKCMAPTLFAAASEEAPDEATIRAGVADGENALNSSANESLNSVIIAAMDHLKRACCLAASLNGLLFV